MLDLSALPPDLAADPAIASALASAEAEPTVTTSAGGALRAVAPEVVALDDATTQLARLLERAGIEVVDREGGVVTGAVEAARSVNWVVAILLLLLGIVPGLLYLFVTRGPSRATFTVRVQPSSTPPSAEIVAADDALVARIRSLIRTELQWTC